MSTKLDTKSLHPWPKLVVTIAPDHSPYGHLMTWEIAAQELEGTPKLNTLQNVVLLSAFGSVDTIEENLDAVAARQRCTQLAQRWLREHGIEPMTVLWHGELL